MTRNRIVLIAAATAVVAFLLGFLPQWSRANRLQAGLDETRFALQTSRVEGRIADAVGQALRSNYEQARQQMTTVFDELESMRGSLEGAQRAEAEAILAQRDEIVTLLARAAPESTQRLTLLLGKYHAAFFTE